MDKNNRDIDQEVVQERETVNSNNGNNMNEDAALDFNQESDLKSETNRKENENAKVEKIDIRPGHIIENVQHEVTCQKTADGVINEEECSNGGVYDKNDQKLKCDPCLFNEIEEKANAFCVVCVEYLCKGCARDHRRSKVTRNHTVLIDDSIPKDQKIFKMMKSLVCCSEHTEMEVSFKCGEHEKFICTKCLVVSHRKCEDVSEASKINRYFIDGETESSVLDMLKEVHDSTVSVRVGKEENIEKLHLDNVCVEKERSEFVESLQSHLQKLNKKAKKATNNTFTKELNALKEEVDKCKDIENQETKCKELLDVAINYGSTVERNVISEFVKQEAEHLKTETKKQEAKVATRLTFKRNQSFTNVATIGNVYVLRGEIKDNFQDEHSRNQMLENSSDVIDETPGHTGKSLYKGPLMQSVVSRTKHMHDLRQTTSGTGLICSVTSMVVLLDGRIVVADLNNKNIKLLGLDFSVKKTCKLDGKPIDMCETSTNNLALLLDGKKTVRKYLVRQKSVHDYGGFPTKLYPVSIARSHKTYDHIVILFSDTEKNTHTNSGNDIIEVQIRSLDNAIIKRFTDFNFETNTWLENTGRIRVLPKVKNVFLISEKEKLHCLEADRANAITLKENWYYRSSDKDSDINEITDIATDKEGNVYVCGRGSKNIHQISGSNFMNNRILLSVPGIPLSVCVDDDRRRVIVGCENDNFIYVTSLE